MVALHRGGSGRAHGVVGLRSCHRCGGGCWRAGNEWSLRCEAAVAGDLSSVAATTTNADATNTAPNIAAPDDFYERLIATHDGLDDAASAALNARLILLLANQIGDAEVLAEALAAARAG